MHKTKETPYSHSHQSILFSFHLMSNGKIVLQIAFQLFLIDFISFFTFRFFLLSPRQRHVEVEGKSKTKEREMTIAGSTMSEYIKFQKKISKDCWHDFNDELEQNDCVGNWKQKTSNHVQLALFTAPTQSIFDLKILFPLKIFCCSRQPNLHFYIPFFPANWAHVACVSKEMNYTFAKIESNLSFFPKSESPEGVGGKSDVN